MTIARERQGRRLDEAAFRRLVDDLKESVRLSSVIGGDIPLKRRGHEFYALCPFHSEKTASFTVNDAGGFYKCFGCGAHGDIFRYVMDSRRIGFREAYQRLASADLPIWSPAEKAAERAADIAAKLEEAALARRWWEEARDPRGTPVERYLRARGITMPPPPSIRFGMVPSWQNKETGEWGRSRPAMLCAAEDRDRVITGLQRIFLDGPRPDKAAVKLNIGVIKGSAFRIGEPQHTIHSTEGPEDGLSIAQEVAGSTVFVSFGTSQLPFVLFPPIVGRIVVCGQNNAPGEVAVENAALALVEQGYEAERRFPDPRYDDWNDQLRQRERS